MPLRVELYSKVNIGSGNALAPNMQPAITWINADLSG